MQGFSGYLQKGQLLACLVMLVLSPCACQRPPEIQTLEPPVLEPLSNLQMSDPQAQVQLLEGFYELEQHRWRWTKRRFRVALFVPENIRRAGEATLELDGYIAPVILSGKQKVIVEAAAYGKTFCVDEYSQPGPFRFKCRLPRELLQSFKVVLDFTVRGGQLHADASRRELGIVVDRVLLEP